MKKCKTCEFIEYMINQKLEIADKENNLFLCLAIGDTLNEIDKKIREIASEEEIISLHEKGLI